MKAPTQSPTQTIGKLYLAATPIGNLDDVSQRFRHTAQRVDGVLCEDTRHSIKLFNHLDLKVRLRSYHQHNEKKATEKIIERILNGESWMLVCDAGTPLIQDPGYTIVHRCHELSIPITFIPGPCAAIAALCLSGQPTNQFQFVGYLPHKSSQRKTFLANYIHLPHTSIFYLSPHRIIAEMNDVADVFDEDRELSLVKEISKLNERVIKGTAQTVLAWLQQSSTHTKGEFILIVAAPPQRNPKQADQFIPSDLSVACVTEMKKYMPLKLATKITAKISSQSNKNLYDFFVGASRQDGQDNQ